METAGNFGVLKEEINDLREGFGELKIRADAAELRIAENEDREIGMTKILLHSLRMQKQLENKCEELEGRERRNNLRIYSVPEKCEGNSMMDFVENLIREKLDVSGEIPIERAHRATGHLTGHSDRPRSIIVRFQNYNVRQRVLQAAWAKKDIRVKDCRIFFDEDFTTQVFKERAKYRQGLLEYGVNMESPAGEPDLESTLQASGWQTHRSRNRRTPGCELMSDVKTLIDSLDRHERAKE
ncbi:hypothetical protein JOQ06_009253 [Pogonophryne albipinna]|uniref:L1 transposable element RRM domain-containing protein n=1 Tax=Pogonophryne albipinna TaxID=1090488 RepID=A0AAD6BQI7_9TELE|nr:hypothetical protein JOQ06_009253 [Pogonophryne albipinna]